MAHFDFEPVKDILRCPVSGSPLFQVGETLISSDPECRLQYAIRDGIPNMLADDATKLSFEDWQRLWDRSQTEGETSPAPATD